MLQRSESRTRTLCAVCVSLIAGSASAQSNPELGDVGSQGQASGQVQVGTAPAAQGSYQTQSPPPAASTVPASSLDPNTPVVVDTAPRFGNTDHALVVGRFGVGLFGVVSVPFGADLSDPDDEAFGATVSAPTIGVRYWLQEDLGIEGALGIGIQSGGTELQSGTTTMEVNGPSVFALALHGGVPLVFAASRHFAFQVIPELNLGFATGGQDGAAGGDDVDLSGFLFEIGARVGAEIQFGFIDIPELALQGTVGLHLRYEGRGREAGDTEVSNSQFRFGTSLQGEPWDMFTGNIAAIYYF
jgi:hypothetical protein